EDGIRDDLVTGVQTCALPISTSNANSATQGNNIVGPTVCGLLAKRDARSVRPSPATERPRAARRSRSKRRAMISTDIPHISAAKGPSYSRPLSTSKWRQLVAVLVGLRQGVGDLEPRRLRADEDVLSRADGGSLR